MFELQGLCLTIKTYLCTVLTFLRAVWYECSRRISFQVRSLSAYLELEGYDRPPFSSLQLQSFHRHVSERLVQEKETVSQVMVRKASLDLLKAALRCDCHNILFRLVNTLMFLWWCNILHVHDMCCPLVACSVSNLWPNAFGICI